MTGLLGQGCGPGPVGVLMCPFKGLGVEYILCLRLKLPRALLHKEGILLPALSFPVILLQLASSGLVFLPKCP